MRKQTGHYFRKEAGEGQRWLEQISLKQGLAGQAQSLVCRSQINAD